LQEASPEPPPPSPPEPAQVVEAQAAATSPITITDADLDAPQEPLGSAFPAGLGLEDDDEGPQDAFAMPVRETSGRPPWIWIAGGIVVLVVAVVLLSMVLGENDAPAPSPNSAGRAAGERATATMCGHVQQMQVFRDDALARARDQLRQDVAALRQAGERQTAKEARAVIGAIEQARRALANQQDTARPFADLEGAIAELPC
jgi:hypothetical protein